MLEIDKQSQTPIYLQIYSQIKQQIISSERKKDERLPATRTLCQEYHISRNTVLNAYQQLESEGFIRSIIGSGYYVEELPQYNDFQTEVSSFHDLTEENKTLAYDFRYGGIEPNVYKSAPFRKALREAMEELEGKEALYDCEPQGLIGLRKAIAGHLKQLRGVDCSYRQIVITSGHHYSISLLQKLLPSSIKCLAIEDPGHRDSRNIFEEKGYDIHPIPLDDNGICVNELMGDHHALAYVTASHQFPLGYILPIGRRLQLLKWAMASESYIIEDDYDSELRYKEQPVPSLFSLDHNDRVIYLGSFSKSLSPDLRISYIIFPAGFSLKKLNTFYPSSSSSLLIQLTLEKYINSMEYRKRISRVRNTLRKKHNRIIEFLKNNYKDTIEIYGAGGGSHFILNLPCDKSQTQIIETFKKYDTLVYPASIYWHTPSLKEEKMILIGYGGIPMDCLDAYLEHLKKGIDELLEKD